MRIKHTFYTFIAFFMAPLLALMDRAQATTTGTAPTPPPPITITGSGDCAINSDDINCMIDSMIMSSQNLPGLISVAAYLTGLTLGVKCVLDIMKHATAGPREMPLRTPIIEFIVSGLLLALPYTYEVLLSSGADSVHFSGSGAPFYVTPATKNEVYMAIGGNITVWTNPATACTNTQFQQMISGLFCNLWNHTSNLPGLIAGFVYVAGLTMMYLATVNLKQSVENPGQISLWVPFQKYVVAALLLMLPQTMAFLYNSLLDNTANFMTTDFDLKNGTQTGSGSDQTLAVIVTNFVFNLHSVMNWMIAGFSYIAGTILIVIGIFRLMKTMQDGPRGPGGIGTIMTFITGSALLAAGPTMGAFATTLFGNNTAETKVDLTIAGGGLAQYEANLENFISAVVAYMLILGWISFLRGLFILRQVAEGGQQASMMSALTHLFAGAILANLGPFLMVVQNTLGPIAGLPGLTFS